MKEKIIITVIAFIAWLTIAIAAPTYKNCGTTAPGQDGACTDAACRTDFGNYAITNCEMDFASSQTNGWNTFCYWSNETGVAVVMNPNGNSLNFYPIAPATSLANLHEYTICKTQRSQDR